MDGYKYYFRDVYKVYGPMRQCLNIKSLFEGCAFASIMFFIAYGYDFKDTVDISET
jgi:hypothetical protein